MYSIAFFFFFDYEMDKPLNTEPYFTFLQLVQHKQTSYYENVLSCTFFFV